MHAYADNIALSIKHFEVHHYSTGHIHLVTRFAVELIEMRNGPKLIHELESIAFGHLLAIKPRDEKDG